LIDVASAEARVVVTGGAGFIGANLCRELTHRGVGNVVVVDDLSTGMRTNLAKLPVTLLQGTVLDAALLDHACEGASTIVHLAARPSVPRSLKDPVATHEANATGTLRVLEAARRCGAAVVVASSSSVYGRNPTLPKHENLVPMPVSPYAVSKLAAESYALAYSQSFGVPSLALRFFNVFGPLQAAGHAYAAVIPSFLDAALAGRPLVVHGDGRQTRDFTFVDTVTEVLATAALEGVTADRPVNLAFGTRTSLLEVVAHLEDLLGHPVEVQHVEARPGDVRDSQADNTLLRGLFPHTRPVQFRHGLAATLAWFRAVASSAV
jgi:UDP-glucose 4-epimerase